MKSISAPTLCPPAPPTACLHCTLGPQRPPSTTGLPPACRVPPLWLGLAGGGSGRRSAGRGREGGQGLSTPPARPEALEAVGTGQSQSDRKQPLTCPPNSAFSVRLTGHMMAAHGLTTGEGASPETAGPRRAASPHCLSLGTGHNKAPPSCPWAPSGIPSCLSLPHLPQSLPSQSPYC